MVGGHPTLGLVSGIWRRSAACGIARGVRERARRIALAGFSPSATNELTTLVSAGPRGCPCMAELRGVIPVQVRDLCVAALVSVGLAVVVVEA